MKKGICLVVLMILGNFIMRSIIEQMNSLNGISASMIGIKTQYNIKI